MIEYWAKRVAFGLLLAGMMLSACSSTRSSAVNEETAIDITWLTKTLQEAGVFVSERGSPDLAIPALSSSRILLDGREILDVFYFERRDKAQAIAYEMANMNPAQDVYLRKSLVVVRSSVGDTGLALTIHNLLGKAL